MNLSKIKLDGVIVKRTASRQGLPVLLNVIKRTNSNRDFVQIFDPELVVNKTHILGAYANALLTFQNKTNKTESMAMEMLLFTAITDQIERAVSLIGAKTASDFVLFASSRRAFERIESLLDATSELRTNTAHADKAAQSLGLNRPGSGDFAALILESMAMSRLKAD